MSDASPMSILAELVRKNYHNLTDARNAYSRIAHSISVMSDAERAEFLSENGSPALAGYMFAKLNKERRERKEHEGDE